MIDESLVPPAEIPRPSWAPVVSNPVAGGSGFKAAVAMTRIGFYDLGYPYAEITQNGTVAQYIEQSNAKYPIVYINKPLKMGKTLILDITNGTYNESKPDLVLTFGLTKCEVDAETHVGRYCGTKEDYCFGKRVYYPVYISKGKKIKQIKVDVIRDEDNLCRLTSIFKDNKIMSAIIEDRSKEKALESAQELYPYIVFNGMAKSVKVDHVEEERGTISKAPARSIPFSKEPTAWDMGSGVDLDDGAIYNRHNREKPIAISKSTLFPGQSSEFSAEKVDLERLNSLGNSVISVFVLCLFAFLLFPLVVFLYKNFHSQG